ncbi:MAG: NADH-quinone oxidoreductase subunit A [Candidatus Aminicenantales bacterium]
MVEIFLVFLVFGLLGLMLILMNRFLGPSRSNPNKEKPFECGSPYLQQEIPPFSIKFYLVAFLFLLFDVEVAFFFPWALVFREMKMSGLLIMFAYLFVLVIGFVYAWRKGAFEWD